MRGVASARAALVIAVLAAGAQSGATSARAAAVTVTCGQVISTNITLANDLTCAGDALSVDTDGVTLNLGGHTIQGNGSGTGITLFPANLDPQITGATVTNGTIAGFAAAFHLIDTVNPTLSRLILTDDGAAPTPVINTDAFNLGLEYVHGLHITHTQITGSHGPVIEGGIGIFQLTIATTQITGGTMYFSQTIGGPTFTDDRITDASLDLDIESGTTITGSTFTRSPILDNGQGGGFDTFQNNTFTGAGTALNIADAGNQQLTGNTFTGNDIGAVINNSLGDTISGNTFTRNATAGLYFNTAGSPAGSGDQPGAQLTLASNTADRNGTHPDGATDPVGNPINAGLYLYTPNGGATITDNNTSHNSGYGIYASLSDNFSNTSSNNTSIHDFARCYPLYTCAYQ